MHAVVVYESHWGNTATIARSIAEGLGPGTPVVATDEATPEVLAAADLVVVGAPLVSFSLTSDTTRPQLSADLKAPTPADIGHPTMRAWLAGLSRRTALYAAFETRLKVSPGSATRKIARGMEDAGYTPAAAPQRFIVSSTYGPLKDGEAERARAWGAGLASSLG